MKILMTNNAFATRTGSELFVKEVAELLKKRGHQVGIYSTKLGKLAKGLKGIEVVDSLKKLSFKPDIIHAQHHLETMTSLAYFSGTPAIYFCHGWRPWQEKPPIHPRILSYATVDTATLDFMVKNNVPKNKIRLIHNFVDTKRFKLRKPLPEKPKKALLFSNAAVGDFANLVKKACDKAKVDLDIVGAAHGNATDKPEELIGKYDLVFARGMCAHEALATGTALIICTEIGIGQMVSLKNMEELRDKNFGVAAVFSDLDFEVLYKEIRKYNAKDSMAVTKKLRPEFDIDTTVDKVEAFYSDVLNQFKKTVVDQEKDGIAFSQYLKELSLFIKEGMDVQTERYNHIIEIQKILKSRENELIAMKEQMQQKDEKIKAMEYSKFWKMREKYVKLKEPFSKRPK